MKPVTPAPGQWFDTGAYHTHGLFGHPRRCVSVSGSRVYFRRYADNAERAQEIEQADPEYCSLQSVGTVFVSLDHALAAKELSFEMVMQIEAAIERVKKHYLDAAVELRKQHSGLEVSAVHDAAEPAETHAQRERG